MANEVQNLYKSFEKLIYNDILQPISKQLNLKGYSVSPEELATYITPQITKTPSIDYSQLVPVINKSKKNTELPDERRCIYIGVKGNINGQRCTKEKVDEYFCKDCKTKKSAEVQLAKLLGQELPKTKKELSSKTITKIKTDKIKITDNCEVTRIRPGVYLVDDYNFICIQKSIGEYVCVGKCDQNKKNCYELTQEESKIANNLGLNYVYDNNFQFEGLPGPSLASTNVSNTSLANINLPNINLPLPSLPKALPNQSKNIPLQGLSALLPNKTTIKGLSIHELDGITSPDLASISDPYDENNSGSEDSDINT